MAAVVSAAITSEAAHSPERIAPSTQPHMTAELGEHSGRRGPAHYLMGFDIGCFTTIFVMSRITGWTAHIMEQTASNALIRPLSEYVGPPQRQLRSAG